MKTSPSTWLRSPRVGALDPPGRIGGDVDLRVADDLAELPVGTAAVVLDVELRRQPEVALAAGCEPNVGADPRDAERADVVALEVVSDHVPGAVLRQQRVRIERALLLLVAVDRPVAELDGPLLRDRAFELTEPSLKLRRVVGIAHLDPSGGVGRGCGERPGRTSEREVLQGEPQRLGIGKPAFEQVEAGLERRELVVVELELGQEVALGPEGVELFAGELVAVAVERHAQRDELRTVGVEAAGECLVAHLLVALDVRLDVPRRQGAALRHQERHQ